MSLRCAIYTRVSTRHQAEQGFSLEDQRAKLTAYAQKQSWSFEVFEDAGLSGELLEQRPALQRLLAGVDAGHFDIVLVMDDSRLARDELVGALIRDRLKRAGVQLATPQGERDLTDPADNFVSNILAAAHAFEQDIRTIKMRAGIRSTAEAGYWTGGPPPYGFRLVPDGAHSRLAIDEDEAATLRLAVDLVVRHGCTTLEAARRLNAMGLKPRQSPEFNHRQLRQILMRETLAGRWTYGVSAGRRSKHGEPITMEVPRIISADLYEQLKVALDTTAKKSNLPYSVYPLSGRIVADCGLTYYGQFRRARMQREYICAGKAATINTISDRCGDRRYPSDDMDCVVWDEVMNLLSEPERLLRLAQDYLGLRGEQMVVERDQLGTIEQKIAELTKALTGHAREALKAGLPAEVIAAATSELTAELQSLTRHRDQLRSWAHHTSAESARNRRLLDLAEAAHTRLPKMSLAEQKQVMGLLDVRVRILEHATRSTPARLSIEGAVHDALFETDAFDDVTAAPGAGGVPFRFEAKVE